MIFFVQWLGKVKPTVSNFDSVSDRHGWVNLVCVRRMEWPSAKRKGSVCWVAIFHHSCLCHHAVWCSGALCSYLVMQRTVLFGLLLCVTLCSVVSMAEDKVLASGKQQKAEQRFVIKFFSARGDTPICIWWHLREVHGIHTLSQTVVWNWVWHFNADPNASCLDLPCCGGPRTARKPRTVARVRRLVCKGNCRTIRDIDLQAWISVGSAHKILCTDLGLCKIAAHYVPKLLTQEQKQRHVQICQENLQHVRDEPFLLRHVITGDESWIYSFDPICKQKASSWVSPTDDRPQTAVQPHSQKRVMMVIFLMMLGWFTMSTCTELWIDTCTTEYLCSSGSRFIARGLGCGPLDLDAAGMSSCIMTMHPCIMPFSIMQCSTRQGYVSYVSPPTPPQIFGSSQESSKFWGGTGSRICSNCRMPSTWCSEAFPKQNSLRLSKICTAAGRSVWHTEESTLKVSGTSIRLTHKWQILSLLCACWVTLTRNAHWTLRTLRMTVVSNCIPWLHSATSACLCAMVFYWMFNVSVCQLSPISS